MSASSTLLQQSRFVRSSPPVGRKLPTRNIWTPYTCLTIHLVLVGLCSLLMYLFTPPIALIMSGILVGTPLLVLGIVEGHRGPLWLNPLSVFLLLLGVQLGPAVVYAGTRLLSEHSLDFPLLSIPAHDVALGYFFTLIGTLTMHVGLRLFRPPAERHLPGPVNWKPHHIVLLYVVGLIAVYIPSAFLFLGIFGGMLQWGCMAVLLAYAFSSANLRSTLAMRLVFAAGLGIYAVAAFFAENSSKSNTMLALLPGIVFLSRRKQYYKWIPLVLALLLLLYLVVVAPAVNTSRSIQERDAYDRIIIGLRSSSPLYSEEPVTLSLEKQFDELMERLFEIPQVTGFMIGEVRRSGFQLGSTMKDLYYAFIPRIIWPQKPTVSRGAWFTTYLGMARSESEATTSTGMTTVGEWYWNFGALGVVVGMFMTGALLSALWRMAGSNPVHQPENMVLYVAIIVNAMNFPDATSPIVSAVALYLFFGTLHQLRRFSQKTIPRSPVRTRAVVTMKPLN